MAVVLQCGVVVHSSRGTARYDRGTTGDRPYIRGSTANRADGVRTRLDLHTLAGPEMAAGAPGTVVMARQRATLDPQELLAVTQTLPAVVPKLTMIEVVP